MMERAMEHLNVQLNRLTRSLRRARTVELPEGNATGCSKFSGRGDREQWCHGEGSWPAGPGSLPACFSQYHWRFQV